MRPRKVEGARRAKRMCQSSFCASKPSLNSWEQLWMREDLTEAGKKGPKTKDLNASGVAFGRV